MIEFISPFDAHNWRAFYKGDTKIERKYKWFREARASILNLLLLTDNFREFLKISQKREVEKSEEEMVVLQIHIKLQYKAPIVNFFNDPIISEMHQEF